jgi:hypothetical protein
MHIWGAVVVVFEVAAQHTAEAGPHCTLGKPRRGTCDSRVARQTHQIADKRHNCAVVVSVLAIVGMAKRRRSRIIRRKYLLGDILTECGLEYVVGLSLQTLLLYECR